MAKQKAKMVDKSLTEDDLKDVVLSEELGGPDEKTRLKAIKEAEKAEKTAKKAAKTEKKEEIQEKIEAKTEESATKPKALKHSRSRKYNKVHQLVDRTKTYALKDAVKLVQKASYSRFAGTVSADLVCKDQKVAADLSFPHSTGRTVRVAIATDALLASVEKGIIDFDILVAAPPMMPKLAKLARILGPKGLMPNPKNQTVVADPEKRAKELSAGKVTVKCEKKAPLMHVVLGKTDMKAEFLVANLESLITALGAKRLTKLVLSATMSPGIKVDLTPYQST